MVREENSACRFDEFFLNAAEFSKNMHAHMCTLIVGLLSAELADTVDPFSVLLDQLLGWYGGK
jgi:hypothetical protein